MAELILKTFDTADLLAKEGLNQIAFRTYLTALTASAKHLSQIELSSLASIPNSENSSYLQIFEIGSVSLLKAYKLYFESCGLPSIPPKASNRPNSRPRPCTLDPDASSLDLGPLLLLTPPSTAPTNRSFQENDIDLPINSLNTRPRDSSPHDLLKKLDTVFSNPFVKKPPSTGGRARARSLVNSLKARFETSSDEPESRINDNELQVSSPQSTLKSMFSSPSLGSLERYHTDPLSGLQKLSTPSLSEEDTSSEKAFCTNSTLTIDSILKFGIDAGDLIPARTLPPPDAPTSSSVPSIPRSPLFATLIQANLRLDNAKSELILLTKDGATDSSKTLKRLQQAISEASATLEKISRLTRIDTFEHTFTFFPPKLIAYQITLIESNIFRNISSDALRTHTHRQPQPSIVASTNFFNFLTRVIELSILDINEEDERVETISFWIQVGETLETLHNFQSLQAVVSGLNTPPLTRLKRTWSRLPKKRLSRLQSIQKLMSESDNYQLYRRHIALLDNSNFSIIPYLGVFIMDMTYLSAIQSKSSAAAEEDLRITQLISRFEVFLARPPHPTSLPSRFLKGHSHSKTASASFSRNSLMASPPISPAMSFLPFVASLGDGGQNGEADSPTPRRKPLQDCELVRQMQLVLSHFILNRPWIPDSAVDRRSLAIEPRPSEFIADYDSQPNNSWFSTSKSLPQPIPFFKFPSFNERNQISPSLQKDHLLDVNVPPHQIAFELDCFQNYQENSEGNQDTCSDSSPTLTSNHSNSMLSCPPTGIIMSSKTLSVPLTYIDN